ncbi:MAG: hypothetical protein UY19_C0008G0058 [Candidatus Wolfebacteria bacterium GW2011_GWA2_47_9b]|uniref:Uncharacterized protein n=2 Tax=Candidatus Wolfeibacteriota TaxID=1752735 RepID=A0A0G1U739_9BACT|nr:MAG: hypothetical protein UX70_C0001G1007 [Candidatus Wolfebacteria bacterium GW2011_GWB1_47_1]KKU65588.1 MAG: hypothetical protein UX90_C0003G0050 [Candidatus Wolfebacteria bacterium GW2011_GWD2_47_17]KKU89904.1 MAG: hypothetical protein UY19_C0008G0058 [Candidatus Wolfebacteria bacterium GW2011_GWA2_47_9b]
MIIGAVLVILGMTAVTAVSASNGSMEARILSAKEKFQSTLSETPQKKVDAIAFFTNDMSLEDVKIAIRNTSLEVKGFRHGTQSYGGGYILKQGETLEEAVSNYQRDHLLFIQKRLDDEDRMIVAEKDDNLRKALITHRTEADQMKTDFKKRGIRVVGVEVYGQAKDINTFAGENPFVRVIELKEKGKPQSAILPGQ